MLQPIYLVAFSGHRPDDSPGRTDAALLAAAPLIEQALRDLKSQVEFNGGELQFICSLAAGSDLIACRAALRLGLALHVILPMPEEEFFEKGFLEKDHHTAWKDPALRILATVHQHPQVTVDSPPVLREILPLTHVDETPLDLSHSRQHTFRILDSAGTTTERYAFTNVKMLEAADALLLVTVPGGKNSSAGTTRLKLQADKISLPHICIDPLHGVTTHHHLDTLASPDAPSRKLMVQIGHHLSPGTSAASDPFPALVRSLQRHANEKARKFRFATGSAITLHAIAGFIAAFAAACYHYFQEETAHPYAFLALFAVVELILVATAFTLEWLGHHRHERETWHLCRFARELLRGIEDSSPFLDPLFPEISRHRPEWDRFAVSAALLLRRVNGPLAPGDVVTACETYVKKRIIGQRDKFRSDADKARLPALLFKKVAHGAALFALPVVAFAAIAKLDHLLGWHLPLPFLGNELGDAVLLLFLPILLPLAASLGISFIATFDFARRAARYPEMVRALDQTSKLLPTLDTLPAITDSVRHTEEILLDELIDWHASQLSSSGG